MSEGAFDGSRIRVVLVEPRYDGNLGQVARAMCNFGLSRLVLVGGSADPLSDESRWFARDEGGMVLDSVTRVAELGAAVGECAVVIGTSRRTGKYRGTPERPEQVFAATRPWSAPHETALVFGREAHGLSTEELDRCDRILFIPTSARSPSLNLAHAVAVVGYALQQAAGGALPPALERDDEGEPASNEQIEGMFQHLRRVWRRIGYLNEQNPDAILRRWRRILHRAPLSIHDINVVRALAHQTDFVARLAKIPQQGPPAARELFDKHREPDPGAAEAQSGEAPPPAGPPEPLNRSRG